MNNEEIIDLKRKALALSICRAINYIPKIIWSNKKCHVFESSPPIDSNPIKFYNSWEEVIIMRAYDKWLINKEELNEVNL